tara:strand:+ start:191 stop:304 length:114 start_codon:yes stop_codon:yes gene_type:complete
MVRIDRIFTKKVEKGKTKLFNKNKIDVECSVNLIKKF